MSALRLSRSGVLAGSMVLALVAASACQDATNPTSTVLPDSPSLAKAKPPAPATGLSLRSTGNTSWSVSLGWDAVAGSASYRIRDNWGREITVPGAQTVNEDAALSIGGVSVSDADGNLATTADRGELVGMLYVGLPLDALPGWCGFGSGVDVIRDFQSGIDRIEETWTGW